MALSILNNIAGLNAQNQLNINNVNLNNTLLRVSSGKRINSGADDAAGLGIASSLKANVMALDQATRNANDAISVLQIADGALGQIQALLTRGITLAEEAATGTVDDKGKTALNTELTSIKDEINRIATQTNYNGVSLFDATATSTLDGTLHVYVGDTANKSSISVTVASIASNSVGNEDISGLNLETDAATAIGTLTDALAGVSGNRADIGAGMNRLQSAVTVLQTQAQNTTAAQSNIEDANMAQEISNMTKYQILAQTGIAALAQANSTSQNVLTLLRG